MNETRVMLEGEPMPAIDCVQLHSRVTCLGLVSLVCGFQNSHFARTTIYEKVVILARLVYCHLWLRLLRPIRLQP